MNTLKWVHLYEVWRAVHEKCSLVCNGDLPVQWGMKFDYYLIPTFIVACGAENIINVNKMFQPFLANVVL